MGDGTGPGSGSEYPGNQGLLMYSAGHTLDLMVADRQFHSGQDYPHSLVFMTSVRTIELLLYY